MTLTFFVLFYLFVICMDNWKNGVAFYEMQKTVGDEDLGFQGVEAGNQEFSSGHIKFKVATRLPRKGIECATGYSVKDG